MSLSLHLDSPEESKNESTLKISQVFSLTESNYKEKVVIPSSSNIKLEFFNSEKTSDVHVSSFKSTDINSKNIYPVNYNNSVSSNHDNSGLTTPKRNQYDQLSSISSHSNLVNPNQNAITLMKEDAYVQNMLQKSKLIHFFKCLFMVCDYTTNDPIHFHNHLMNHKIEKVHCFYCLKMFQAEDLVIHQCKYHSFCIYQCSQCFMRFSSKPLAFEHSHKAHSQSASAHIMTCEKISLTADQENMIQKRDTNLSRSSPNESRKLQIFLLKVKPQPLRLTRPNELASNKSLEKGCLEVLGNDNQNEANISANHSSLKIHNSSLLLHRHKTLSTFDKIVPPSINISSFVNRTQNNFKNPFSNNKVKLIRKRLIFPKACLLKNKVHSKNTSFRKSSTPKVNKCLAGLKTNEKLPHLILDSSSCFSPTLQTLQDEFRDKYKKSHSSSIKEFPSKITQNELDAKNYLFLESKGAYPPNIKLKAISTLGENDSLQTSSNNLVSNSQTAADIRQNYEDTEQIPTTSSSCPEFIEDSAIKMAQHQNNKISSPFTFPCNKENNFNRIDGNASVTTTKNLEFSHESYPFRANSLELTPKIKLTDDEDIKQPFLACKNAKLHLFKDNPSFKITSNESTLSIHVPCKKDEGIHLEKSSPKNLDQVLNAKTFNEDAPCTITTAHLDTFIKSKGSNDEKDLESSVNFINCTNTKLSSEKNSKNNTEMLCEEFQSKGDCRVFLEGANNLSSDEFPSSKKIVTSPSTMNKRVNDAQISSPFSKIPSKFMLFDRWTKILNQNTIEKKLLSNKLKHLFKCSELTCTYTTDSPLKFYKHIGFHSQNDYVCIYCSKIFPKKDITFHIVEDHHQLKYQCNHCFFRCSTVINIRKHQMQSHPNLKHKCLYSPYTNLLKGLQKLQSLQKKLGSKIQLDSTKANLSIDSNKEKLVPKPFMTSASNSTNYCLFPLTYISVVPLASSNTSHFKPVSSLSTNFSSIVTKSSHLPQTNNSFVSSTNTSLLNNNSLIPTPFSKENNSISPSLMQASIVNFPFVDNSPHDISSSNLVSNPVSSTVSTPSFLLEKETDKKCSFLTNSSHLLQTNDLLASSLTEKPTNTAQLNNSHIPTSCSKENNGISTSLMQAPFVNSSLPNTSSHVISSLNLVSNAACSTISTPSFLPEKEKCLFITKSSHLSQTNNSFSTLLVAKPTSTSLLTNNSIIPTTFSKENIMTSSLAANSSQEISSLNQISNLSNSTVTAPSFLPLKETFKNSLFVTNSSLLSQTNNAFATSIVTKPTDTALLNTVPATFSKDNSILASLIQAPFLNSSVAANSFQDISSSKLVPNDANSTVSTPSSLPLREAPTCSSLLPHTNDSYATSLVSKPTSTPLLTNNSLIPTPCSEENNIILSSSIQAPIANTPLVNISSHDNLNLVSNPASSTLPTPSFFPLKETYKKYLFVTNSSHLPQTSNSLATLLVANPTNTALLNNNSLVLTTCSKENNSVVTSLVHPPLMNSPLADKGNSLTIEPSSSICNSKKLLSEDCPNSLESMSQNWEVVLKLKDARSLGKMLVSSKLKLFFKCLVKSCIHASNDPVYFYDHISCHLESEFPCLYCFQRMQKAALLTHQIQDHGSYIYQCNFCFFRSPCESQAEEHQKKAHGVKIPSPLHCKPISRSKEAIKNFCKMIDDSCPTSTMKNKKTKRLPKDNNTIITRSKKRNFQNDIISNLSEEKSQIASPCPQGNAKEKSDICAITPQNKVVTSTPINKFNHKKDKALTRKKSLNKEKKYSRINYTCNSKTTEMNEVLSPHGNFQNKNISSDILNKVEPLKDVQEAKDKFMKKNSMNNIDLGISQITNSIHANTSLKGYTNKETSNCVYDSVSTCSRAKNALVTTIKDQPNITVTSHFPSAMKEHIKEDVALSSIIVEETTANIHSFPVHNFSEKGAIDKTNNLAYNPSSHLETNVTCDDRNSIILSKLPSYSEKNNKKLEDTAKDLKNQIENRPLFKNVCNNFVVAECKSAKKKYSSLSKNVVSKFEPVKKRYSSLAKNIVLKYDSVKKKYSKLSKNVHLSYSSHRIRNINNLSSFRKKGNVSNISNSQDFASQSITPFHTVNKYPFEHENTKTNNQNCSKNIPIQNIEGASTPDLVDVSSNNDVILHPSNNSLSDIPLGNHGSLSDSQHANIVNEHWEIMYQLKDSKSLNQLLKAHKLRNFFKCMVNSCDHSTDDPLFFIDHMLKHTNDAFSCIYCFKMFKAKELVLHMILAHSTAIFQCSVCFYRCAFKSTMLAHQKMFHDNNPFAKIYRMKEIKLSLITKLKLFSLLKMSPGEKEAFTNLTKYQRKDQTGQTLSPKCMNDTPKNVSSHTLPSKISKHSHYKSFSQKDILTKNEIIHISSDSDKSIHEVDDVSSSSFNSETESLSKDLKMAGRSSPTQISYSKRKKDIKAVGTYDIRNIYVYLPSCPPCKVYIDNIMSQFNFAPKVVVKDFMKEFLSLQ